MIFTISPDENPGDSGTMAGGLNEREQNLAVVGYLKPALERCGQIARFDQTLTYIQRVAAANNDLTDVLVAIAHNAGPPAAEGTQFIFCAAPNGHGFGMQDQAAQAIGAELVAAGIASKWGTYDENVYECCQFKRDTVYIEVLFQSNPRDLAKMQEPGYHQRAAEAIARGLAATYGFAYVQPAGVSPPPFAVPAPAAGTPIMGAAVATGAQMYTMLQAYTAGPWTNIVDAYLTAGAQEGVRGDGAFCQAMHETGWLKYGGEVKAASNNFAGIRTVDGSGFQSYDSVDAGVRAHLRHLRAYATTDPLPPDTDQVDPRAKVLSRGSATTFLSLGGRWAPATEYGKSIEALLAQLLTVSPAATPAPPPIPPPESESTFQALSHQIDQLQAENARLKAQIESMKQAMMPVRATVQTLVAQLAKPELP